jgi:hypothetical protein
MRRRSMKRMIAWIPLLFLAGACAHVDYVGKSYPPTSKVEIFFAEEDVVEPYEIMGRVVATADEIVSAEKMQDQIMEKAQKKGADAVVITGLDRYKSGETTNYTETTKEKKSGVTTTSGGSSTESENKKEITALFLKYK